MIADGKKIAEQLESEISQALLTMPEKYLCFVMVGDNPASEQFIAMKTKVAKRLGVMVDVEYFDGDITEHELIQNISNLCDEGFDGIVIQLPLPEHLTTQTILDCVPAHLDCDMLGTAAKQMYARGDMSKIPPVARAVSEILHYYDIHLADKKILVVGNGKLVGEPVAAMLGHNGYAFELIDKDTSSDKKASLLKSSDVIISGVGVGHMIKPDMIQEGCVLIDAGTSEQSGKMIGDIDPSCADKSYLMTPVPGGVGPVTVACLFANLVTQ